MLLDVQNIVKEYRLPGQKPLRVLDGVSFAVEPGEHVAVVGRSGAGKTTLLNLLGGLDAPTSGDVLLDGASLFNGWGASRRRTRLRATRMGFVFQSFHLMPELDIVENVMLPTMAASRSLFHGSRSSGGKDRGSGTVSRPNGKGRAIELLERVGLGGRLDHLPAELSGGEQQRVAIARALMCRPSIVFADEPTGNLDALTGSEILKLLFEVNDEPLACVMVTHSSDAAARCDRILTLSDGRMA